MNNIRLWLVLKRATGPAVAGLIVFIVLTIESHGLFEHWTPSGTPLPHVPRSTRPPTADRSGAPPISITPLQPMGNDSSVSAIPLPLILVSTRPGRNNREGSAQIGVNAQSPQTYAAGALLANHARLTEIYPSYVVLERDGRSARLYIAQRPQREEIIDASILTVGGEASPVPPVTISSDALGDYIRPTPVYDGDSLRGLALYEGRKGTAFSQMGLQEGDLLTHINGNAVQSVAESIAQLETLSQGAALVVIVERHGEPQTLSLDGSMVLEALSRKKNETSPSVTKAPI